MSEHLTFALIILNNYFLLFWLGICISKMMMIMMMVPSIFSFFILFFLLASRLYKLLAKIHWYLPPLLKGIYFFNFFSIFELPLIFFLFFWVCVKSAKINLNFSNHLPIYNPLSCMFFKILTLALVTTTCNRLKCRKSYFMADKNILI